MILFGIGLIVFLQMMILSRTSGIIEALVRLGEVFERFLNKIQRD
jgi:hypothetical protein